MSCVETDRPGVVSSALSNAQAWALAVIEAPSLEGKLNPGACPVALDGSAAAPGSPSRPAPLRVVARAPKTPRPGAMQRPEARARLLHTFAHHELQAAEIFCWAFLCFPNEPESFRRGLLKIAQDELRHARQYIVEIERLGSSYGAHPVRDWFWERFASVRTPLQFVSLMGIGFEGGNLDHCERWASLFRGVGDEAGARCQEHIGREEEQHVAFAVNWFEHYAGPLNFERWRAELPAPLTPTVMHGAQLAAQARTRAGLEHSFQEALIAWDARPPGS